MKKNKWTNQRVSEFLQSLEEDNMSKPVLCSACQQLSGCERLKQGRTTCCLCQPTGTELCPSCTKDAALYSETRILTPSQQNSGPKNDEIPRDKNGLSYPWFREDAINFASIMGEIYDLAVVKNYGESYKLSGIIALIKKADEDAHFVYTGLKLDKKETAKVNNTIPFMILEPGQEISLEVQK